MAADPRIPPCPACGTAHVGRHCPGTFSPSSDRPKMAENDLDVATWRAGGPMLQGPQQAAPPAPPPAAPLEPLAPVPSAPLPIAPPPAPAWIPPAPPAPEPVPAWRAAVSHDLPTAELIRLQDGQIRLVGFDLEGRIILFARIGLLLDTVAA